MLVNDGLLGRCAFSTQYDFAPSDPSDPAECHTGGQMTAADIRAVSGVVTIDDEPSHLLCGGKGGRGRFHCAIVDLTADGGAPPPAADAGPASATVEIRVWEDVNDPLSNFISARVGRAAAGGRLARSPCPLPTGIAAAGATATATRR